jgi:peptidoglycan hydrolase-like protein with peptidoglycan-binding domain
VPAVGPKAQLGSPRFMGTDGHTPDATLEAVYEDRLRLHAGSPKAAVKKVQQALLDIGGYDLGPTGVDGIYGNYTATAVKLFKHNEHLGSEELGDVGPATINRLDDIFATKTP